MIRNKRERSESWNFNFPFSSILQGPSHPSCSEPRKVPTPRRWMGTWLLQTVVLSSLVGDAALGWGFWASVSHGYLLGDIWENTLLDLNSLICNEKDKPEHPKILLRAKSLWNYISMFSKCSLPFGFALSPPLLILIDPFHQQVLSISFQVDHKPMCMTIMVISITIISPGWLWDSLVQPPASPLDSSLL